MSDFAFQIVADASKADKAIDVVVTGLEKIPAKAAAVGNATTRGFDAAARAAKRAHDAHARLTAQAQPVAQGFGKIAEAIKREQDMLEAIHGPARRYEQDLKALNALHERGAITAKEHAAQLANIRDKSNTGGGSKGNGLPFSGMMGMAGAATAGTAAIAVLQQYDAAMREAEDHYTELTNRASKFTGAGRNVNAVVEEQTGLGARLNSTAAQTIEVYDSVNDATESLNLTSSEQIRLTETLGKDAQLAGRSMEAAGDVMQRLSVAFETGANTGGTLRKLFFQFPDLATQLTHSLGLTKEQIIELANTGRLGFADIARGLTHDTEVTDNAYAKIKRTHAQAHAQFEEAINKTAADSMGLGNTLEDMLMPAVDQMNARMGKTKTGVEIVNETLTQLGRISDSVAGEHLTNALGGALEGLTSDLSSASHALGELANKLADSPLNRALGAGQGRADVVRQAKIDLKALDIEYQTGVKNATDYKQEHQRLVDVINNVSAASRAAAKEIKDLGKALLGSESPSDRAIRQGAAERAAFQAGVEADAQAEIDAENRAYKNEQDNIDGRIKAENEWRAAVTKATDDAAEARLKLEKDTQDAAKKTKEAWAQGAGSIAGDLIAAFRKGDQSMDQMVSHAMEQLAILAIQMAAMQIGGPAGAFIGAAAAGGLAGHASGTQFTVGGASSDTNLVAFRATRGERVTVETEQDQRTGRYFGGGGGGGDVRVVNQYQNDPRAMRESMSGRDGERVIVNQMRQMGMRQR